MIKYDHLEDCVEDMISNVNFIDNAENNDRTTMKNYPTNLLENNDIEDFNR